MNDSILPIDEEMQKLEIECNKRLRPIWLYMANLYSFYNPKLIVSCDFKIIDTIWPDELKGKLAEFQLLIDEIVLSYRAKADKIRRERI